MSLIGDMFQNSDDTIWKALADPTRRRILETLSDRTVTTGEIVDRFSPKLVRTAVMKHLDVLESANLIRIERIGRNRLNHIERKPLECISGWLQRHVTNHRENLTRLKNLTESKSPSPKPNHSK